MTWRERAACRGEPLSVFYPEFPGRVPAEARDLCARCPVELACLEDALLTPEQADYGIRARTTPRGRRRIKEQRRRNDLYETLYERWVPMRAARNERIQRHLERWRATHERELEAARWWTDREMREAA